MAVFIFKKLCKSHQKYIQIKVIMLIGILCTNLVPIIISTTGTHSTSL